MPNNQLRQPNFLRPVPYGYASQIQNFNYQFRPMQSQISNNQRHRIPLAQIQNLPTNLNLPSTQNIQTAQNFPTFNELIAQANRPTNSNLNEIEVTDEETDTAKKNGNKRGVAKGTKRGPYKKKQKDQ